MLLSTESMGSRSTSHPIMGHGEWSRERTRGPSSTRIIFAKSCVRVFVDLNSSVRPCSLLTLWIVVSFLLSAYYGHLHPPPHAYHQSV